VWANAHEGFRGVSPTKPSVLWLSFVRVIFLPSIFHFSLFVFNLLSIDPQKDHGTMSKFKIFVLMNKDQIKKLLDTRAAQLRGDLESFSDENPKIAGDFETKFERFGESLEDAAAETEQYIDKLPAEHHLELRLKAVEDALKRLKAGKYGICEECGKKIPAARLEVLPEARLCMACERK